MNLQSDLEEVREFWDNEADTFDNEPDHGMHDPIVREAWKKLLVDWLPSSRTSVLDVGCGTGSLSLLLAELNYEVAGIDLSEEMITRAKTKTEVAGYEILFEVMDAFNPHFPPQQFDVIVCRHLLWTLPEPAVALQRWSNMLVPGGRILLIEGHWHTGVGLQSQQVVEALPSTFITVAVKDLSDNPHLWGGAITDERYIVVADQFVN